MLALQLVIKPPNKLHLPRHTESSQSAMIYRLLAVSSCTDPLAPLSWSSNNSNQRKSRFRNKKQVLSFQAPFRCYRMHFRNFQILFLMRIKIMFKKVLDTAMYCRLVNKNYNNFWIRMKILKMFVLCILILQQWPSDDIWRILLFAKGKVFSLCNQNSLHREKIYLLLHLLLLAQPN